MNILVVDDDRFNLKIAEDLIKNNITDCSVFLCSIPDKTLTELAAHDIDIILLDIIMPGITGIELLKIIRSQNEYKDIQIIMFTGIKDRESFKACFENGANDYINKPINFIEFIARVKASIKARKSILSLIKLNKTITGQYKKLRTMTQELKNTQFSLLQKEKLAALGEIAAGIAHEINNPIGFIASNLTTMNSYMRKIKEIRYQYKEFFQTVSNETTLSNRLIEAKNNIISREKEQKIDFIMDDLDAIIAESLEGTARISKIVGSMQEFAKTGTEDKMTHNNFNQIIDECLLIIKHDIKSAAEIDRQLQKNLYLSCNKGEIGQVILNILLNSIYAIKTTSVGKGKITIKAYDSAEYIFCIISDTGSGIKEEDLSRIFDPFFTTKDVGHGVGLGLSVAYDIVVKKHNGSLSATSKLSEGTTFTIKLPKEHKY